jgi:tetratricopeptide (TPR) repeat protein
MSQAVNKGWLLWLLPSAQDTARRIADLTEALVNHPDSPALYLSRAEAYAELEEYNQAADDFRRAARLADEQFKTKSWGVVTQVLRDRALRGLQQAQAAARAGNQGGNG